MLQLGGLLSSTSQDLEIKDRLNALVEQHVSVAQAFVSFFEGDTEPDPKRTRWSDPGRNLLCAVKASACRWLLSASLLLMGSLL